MVYSATQESTFSLALVRLVDALRELETIGYDKASIDNDDEEELFEKEKQPCNKPKRTRFLNIFNCFFK